MHKRYQMTNLLYGGCVLSQQLKIIMEVSTKVKGFGLYKALSILRSLSQEKMYLLHIYKKSNRVDIFIFKIFYLINIHI